MAEKLSTAIFFDKSVFPEVLTWTLLFVDFSQN